MGEKIYVNGPCGNQKPSKRISGIRCGDLQRCGKHYAGCDPCAQGVVHENSVGYYVADMGLCHTPIAFPEFCISEICLFLPSLPNKTG